MLTRDGFRCETCQTTSNIIGRRAWVHPEVRSLQSIFVIDLAEIDGSGKRSTSIRYQATLPFRLSKDGQGVRKILKGDRIAICLLISMAGCRHASVQDDPNWPSPGPVDVASLPPIHSVINHGTTDPDALLANRPPAGPPGQDARAAQTAAPIVLGPLNSKGTKEFAATDAQSDAPVAIASPPSPPIETSQAAPPNPTGPVAATSQPAAQTSLPPSFPPAVSAVPQPRDEAVRPARSSNESATLPTQLPNSPMPGPISQPANEAVSPALPASLPTDAPKVPGNEISGTPPKEIDFEGLPASAVSAGRVAAKIGKDVITVYDLNIAIQEWIRTNVPAGQAIPRREGLFIAKMVCGQMIDRILIIQEAHRMMKSEKQKEALFKQIDQVWQEQQIPPLLRKYKVDTPYELDQALKKQGRSLEAARKEFMDDAVAHEFMGMKLGGKIYVSLVDMRKFYNEHRQDFDRPAQLTWREIRIPVEPGKVEDVRKQAREILEQIRTHSDFATLAKRYDKGPTADQGGLWETSPGGFAVAEINTALEALQPGQVSGVIETPMALFIVKLESRREAGPARFDEVQAEIRKKLSEEKLGKAASTYLQDLRKSTVIWTIFDDIADPRAALADKQLQRTNSEEKSPSPQAAPNAPVLPSPQNASPADNSAPAFSERLPNLNPAGPIPPKGTMSGLPAPPL
jgi:parvulin-like peptidyl-prolyl isomerase